MDDLRPHLWKLAVVAALVVLSHSMAADDPFHDIDTVVHYDADTGRYVRVAADTTQRQQR